MNNNVRLMRGSLNLPFAVNGKLNKSAVLDYRQSLLSEDVLCVGVSCIVNYEDDSHIVPLFRLNDEIMVFGVKASDVNAYHINILGGLSKPVDSFIYLLIRYDRSTNETLEGLELAKKLLGSIDKSKELLRKIYDSVAVVSIPLFKIALQYKTSIPIYQGSYDGQFSSLFYYVSWHDYELYTRVQVGTDLETEQRSRGIISDGYKYLSIADFLEILLYLGIVDTFFLSVFGSINPTWGNLGYIGYWIPVPIPVLLMQIPDNRFIDINQFSTLSMFLYPLVYQNTGYLKDLLGAITRSLTKEIKNYGFNEYSC